MTRIAQIIVLPKPNDQLLIELKKHRFFPEALWLKDSLLDF